ncbi:MAG: NAD(+) synthase [Gammaproteobacteria bacterium]|nr:NAD(+) synthase [Gammaproteobacteria bacterium]MDH5799219.1 NAD(+) synthase [Gammaproteobacteria bacterium]
MPNTPLSQQVLNINEAEEVAVITNSIRDHLRKNLNRRGLVVAISGGVDSAVCAALCVEAIGKNKVFGLLLPETDSSSKSVTLGKQLADQLGIDYQIQDIAPALESIGCYQWRDDAIRKIFPDYGQNWKNKLTISGGSEGQMNHFMLVVQDPEGNIKQERLKLKEYLQIVASVNYKQRIRKTVEYFHADRLNYAVVGTPNRLEYDQGFFVKNGDGSADIKPIAHLYKTQVYTLARYFNLPMDICNAAPTTDTYSMAQGQDEFYFALPYNKMDLALWAHNNGLPHQDLAEALNISVDQAGWIYRDIESKRRATKYLHTRPLLIQEVNEI